MVIVIVISCSVIKEGARVPATSAPIEHVFNHTLYIVAIDQCRCRSLPKNYEHLIHLKVNAGEL